MSQIISTHSKSYKSFLPRKGLTDNELLAHFIWVLAVSTYPLACEFQKLFFPRYMGNLDTGYCGITESTPTVDILREYMGIYLTNNPISGVPLVMRLEAWMQGKEL